MLDDACWRAKRHLPGLALGASSIAIAAALYASPAQAACDATAPLSDTTVTCDTDPPNPETDPIVASGSTGVTVEFEAGAGLQTAASPAISLGGGYLDLATGAWIADFDPSGTPASIGEVSSGAFTGVADYDDLITLFTAIRAELPIRPTPGDPTIALGIGDTDATQTMIQEITAKVTVNKATMADRATNAIAHLESNSPPPLLPLPTPPGVSQPGATGANTVFLDAAAVQSAGAGAISSAAGSALNVTAINGGTVSTQTANAPGVWLDGIGALQVVLENSAIATFVDGSAGIGAVSADTALDVLLYGDSRIYTAGDNSAAILGPGGNSVFNLEANGANATEDRPLIATFGDSSPGISVSGAGSSTATLQFYSLASTLGPALQTSGDNSGLIAIDLGPASSLNLVGQSATFGTFGDGSGVIDLSVGDGSDLLLFLKDATLTSEGTNAPLVETSRGSGSLLGQVLVGTTLMSSSDGSGGVVNRVVGSGDVSSDTYFLADTTVETLGANAPAFLVEAGGESSSRTVQIIAGDPSGESKFSTIGANSPAIYVDSLGDGSVSDMTMIDVVARTEGAASSGVFFGGAGGSTSGSTLSLQSVEVSTAGANSAAIEALGVMGSSGVASFDINEATITTEGVDSVGLRLVPFQGAGSGSASTVALNLVTVTTLGDGSTGIIIGDDGRYSGAAPGPFSGSVVVSGFDLTIDTSGNDADGLVVYGLGSGVSGSNVLTFFQDIKVITSGDRSRGFVAELGTPQVTDSFFNTVFSSLDIKTTGEDAHGFVLNGPGPTASDSNTPTTTVIGNSTVLTEGRNADALVIGERVALSLVSGNNGTLTAWDMLVTGEIDTFDTFTATGAGGRSVMNNGIIYDTFTIGDGIRGNLANNGLIESAAGAGGVAVEFDTDTDIDDIFELQPMGQVIGRVLAGLGDEDAFILGGAGSGTFDVGLLDADGSDDGEQYQGFDTFTKEDASAWTLTGSNDEISLFTITGGSLLVNATIANADIQLVGGTLGGTGTIASFTAMAGAAVSPGNSIGVLNVAGTATFNAGSFYDVEVNATGASDRIVADDADLNPGAVVRVTAAPGGYATTTTYTILTTTVDPLSGTFDPVPVVDLAFLDGSLSYDPNNVYLTLTRNTTDFASLARTPNQLATATAIDAIDLAGGDLPYDELLGLTTGEVPEALDQLSGEAHAAIAGALLAQSRFPRQAVFDRVQQAFDALDASGAAMGYAGGALPSPDPGYVIWGHGYGDIGVLASDGNAALTTSSAAGFLVGADASFDGDHRLGIFAGVGHTAIAARNTDATSTDLTVGAYGGAEMGVVRATFGAAYTHHMISTERSISFAAVSDTVSASYGAGTAQVFGELSRPFEVEGLTLTPFANLALVGHGHGAFSETGGAGALDVAAGTSVAAFTTIGLRAEHSFILEEGVLVRAEGNLGWRHAFADTPTSTNAFATGPDFTVAAAPIASDAIVIGGRLTIDPSEALKITLGYEGQFASGFASHAARLTLGGSF